MDSYTSKQTDLCGVPCWFGVSFFYGVGALRCLFTVNACGGTCGLNDHCVVFSCLCRVMLELVLLRRWYVCWTGGRSEGPRRRRRSEHVDKNLTMNSNWWVHWIYNGQERFRSVSSCPLTEHESWTYTTKTITGNMWIQTRAKIIQTRPAL
jgi:hypothetical protein